MLCADCLGLDITCNSRLARKSSKNTIANALYNVEELSVLVTTLVKVLNINVGVGVEVVVSVVTNVWVTGPFCVVTGW